MPAGGRRRGAGAPRGNLNALKTGAYSRRARGVITALLANPETRAVLLRLGRNRREGGAAFREIIVASVRLLYDRPVSEELQGMVDRIIEEYRGSLDYRHVARVVRGFQRRIGVDDYVGVTAARRHNKIFRAFYEAIVGEPPPALASKGAGRADAVGSGADGGAGGEGVLVGAAGLHDEGEALAVLEELDVRERVAVDDEDVGELAGLDGADVLLHVDAL